jgi:SAM-dependent methyltransferase
MSATGWNHNIHYYDLALRSIPSPCLRALDVGCGTGMLARQLAGRCREVVAIDLSRDALSRARGDSALNDHIILIEGDVLTCPFVNESFDFIVAVASLHHLPLRPALLQLQSLLRPGGVLAIIGLYKNRTPEDYAWAGAAVPISWIMRVVRRYLDVTAPVQAPKETLSEIRQACESLLPGSIVRRRLFFRYSVIWCKASAADKERKLCLRAEEPDSEPGRLFRGE